MADKEMDALVAVISVLSDLTDEERTRVLSYVSKRYSFERLNLPAVLGREERGDNIARTLAESKGQQEFAELFAEAQPQTEKEKALVAAYWVQVVRGEGSFVSQSLNTELKHLGHGVGNITDALDRLIDERPQLILQLRKEGSTKQARKVYKLTYEGVKRVDGMKQRSNENG
jgi:hypothetical protein